MTLRALIVDDEHLARRRIRTLLESEPDFVVMGECSSGREAIETTQREAVDVVFLDIGMPDMSGLEALPSISAAGSLLIVFVTAHGEHALEAFDAQAVDYLLKPFEDERFTVTLHRLRRFASNAHSSAGSIHPRRLLGASLGADVQRLAVKTAGRTTLLDPAEIQWIEADGSYVQLHTPEHSYLLRDSMTRIEQALAPHGFARIHRSSIVRLAEVRELGEHEVVLRDGTTLGASERYWADLRARLGL